MVEVELYVPISVTGALSTLGRNEADYKSSCGKSVYNIYFDRVRCLVSRTGRQSDPTASISLYADMHWWAEQVAHHDSSKRTGG